MQDRVRAALRKEEDEAELPHKRKRKHKDSEGDEKEEEEDSREKSKAKSSERPSEEKPIKKKVNVAPPPPSFEQLLKLAEEKKGQPVDIEKMLRDRPKEPDRPMTQKEKVEWQREQERKINRERRERGLPPLPSQFDDRGKPKPAEKSAKFRIPKSGSSESSKPPERETKKEEKSEPKPSEPYKRMNVESSRKAEPARSSSNDKPKSSISLKRSEERSRPVEKKTTIKDDTADLDDIDREIELLRRKRMLLEKSKLQAQTHAQRKPSEKPKAPSISSKAAVKVPEKSRPCETVKPRPSSGSFSSKPKEQPSKGPPKLAGAKEVMRPSYLPPTKPKNKLAQKPKRKYHYWVLISKI